MNIEHRIVLKYLSNADRDCYVDGANSQYALSTACTPCSVVCRVVALHDKNISSKADNTSLPVCSIPGAALVPLSARGMQFCQPMHGIIFLLLEFVGCRRLTVNSCSLSC